jgi:hypothetical protein
MHKKIFSALALLLLLAPCSQAAMKFAKKGDLLTSAAVSNPRPAAGDVLLPMPNGLHMAFRHVCVPASGYLDSVEVQHGIAADGASDASGDASVGGIGSFTDHAHTVNLSAIYELDDLPQAWGEDALRFMQTDPACAASSVNRLRPYMYFIGKYEVSRAQWRAVMEQEAPFTIQPDDYLPQTDVSWFENIDFSRRYSEWLMANHPEYLPVFQQERMRPSFIRLPTEVEWEFAARGGHRVDPAERSRTRFHPLADGENIKNYIAALAFDETLSQLSPIGSRRPNPLGLHDMLGNSAEMVFSPFQLVSGNKMSGNTGGFVFKGGSWRASNFLDLHPGRRVEGAYYVDGRAMRRDDVGLRAAIGSILTPRDRWSALKAEWLDRIAPRAAQADAGRDDVRVIIREVTKYVENPELRRRLAEAESVASLYHQKVNENEDRMMRENIIGALFSLETIANYSVRCFAIIKTLESSKILMEEKIVNDSESRIKKAEVQIMEYMDGIHGAFFYYKNMLDGSLRFNDKIILTQLEKVGLQFMNSSNGFSRSMAKRLSIFEKHISGKSTDLTEQDLLKSMLPPSMLDSFHPYLQK